MCIGDGAVQQSQAGFGWISLSVILLCLPIAMSGATNQTEKHILLERYAAKTLLAELWPSQYMSPAPSPPPHEVKRCNDVLFAPARFAELEQYTELDFKPTTKKHCDVTVKKPTILMKLDAGTPCHLVARHMSLHVLYEIL